MRRFTRRLAYQICPVCGYDHEADFPLLPEEERRSAAALHLERHSTLSPELRRAIAESWPPEEGGTR